METEGQRLRFVWFMLHSGYLRYFGSVVRLLAARGHEVHLAFSRLEKDAGDARLPRELAAEHPNVTYGLAPARSRGDGWRPIAALVRGLTDLGRYAHPRYADADALRARMAGKLTERIRAARVVDPLSSRLTVRIVRLVESHTSEAFSRRMLRALGGLERAVPTASRIDAFLAAGRRPDAVLVTPVVEFASPQVEYVKSARKLRIPSAVAVASWDNLTGKGLIRVAPDRVLVWNEIQASEATELHDIPREHVVVTGAPKFDDWFERTTSSPYADFAARVGLDPSRPYVLYTCSSSFIAPDEVGFVRAWLERLRRDPRPVLAGLGALVRPHPQNAGQWSGVDLAGLGNATVWPPLGAQPDAGQERTDFFDSLAHSAAVVGINTSALLEAAILGKTVLAPLPPQFAGTQQGTLHFRYLLVENGGFVRTAKSLDAHADQLAGALERGDEQAERTRRFAASFLRPRGVERPAAPIAADAVEALAHAVPEPLALGPLDSLLRVLLAPAALAVSAVGVVAGRLRQPADAAAGPSILAGGGDAGVQRGEAEGPRPARRAPEVRGRTT
ncbi:MAG TPA: hypothetical protein VH760_02255 [Gaiellaceae bacterium]|jgi:hypothetical protein